MGNDRSVVQKFLIPLVTVLCLLLQPFDSERKCYDFLQELVDTGECELFIVVKESAATEQ